jgi:hypothetical protein
MSSTLDPARRAELVGSMLRAIVVAEGSTPVGDPAGLGGGAAIMSDDGTAWALLGERSVGGLGGALAWALRRDAKRVHVIASEGAGALARRAAWFTVPITVSRLADRVLVPAVAEPLPASAPVPTHHRDLAALIVAGGAEPTEEHGVLAGEVAGLEVCRVVDDLHTGVTRLEVGVGAHDRETFQLVHGDRPTVEALADVVRAVVTHRSVGAEIHPLNQLGASRLLRSRVIAQPALVDPTIAALVAAEPPLPRTNLKDQVPCVATEVGGSRIVVCSTGVDLEVVAFAGDAAARHGADGVIIAAPARDVLDIQQRLASLLVVPTRFAAVASANSSS